MTPRELDWRSVRPKLRKIEELVAALEGVGPVDAAGGRRLSAVTAPGRP